MSAAIKLTPQERELAPRIWKTVGPDMRVRVIDYDWVISRRGLPAGAEPEEPAAPTIAADLVSEYRKPVGPAARMIARVAELHGVSVQQITGDSRLPKIVSARQHAAYELCKMGKSLPDAGRMLGDRDHTTILHAVRVWPAKAAKLGIPVDVGTA